MNNNLTLSTKVQDWLARRSADARQWSAQYLLAAKEESGTRVSVVMPARNEEATVAEIVASIRRHLMDDVPLVDELIVIDSRSEDATAVVAAAAGATVVHQDSVLSHLPPLDGKGEALWKGLAASTGDVIVFVDADLHSFGPEYVTGLLGPLLTDPSVAYVKGFYHRPLIGAAGTEPDGGGRVTELVARPLINLHWPELAGFVQPLAGEYAGRREALERVPFVTGYGVELGHLVDLLQLVGLDSLAQVDLGYRQHRNQSTQALGRMAGQIMLTALSRLERQGRLITADEPATLLTQFRRGDSPSGVQRETVVTDVAVADRPPLASLRATGTLAPLAVPAPRR